MTDEVKLLPSVNAAEICDGIAGDPPETPTGRNDDWQHGWQDGAMACAAEIRARAPAPQEADGWRPGDDGAKSGDLIEAVFEYRNVATQQDHREYMIVWWNNGRWEFADGEGYDRPSEELPALYRRFRIPPLSAPPSAQEGDHR